MTIHINHLQIDCIIGILDFEREHPQAVILDAEITYTYNGREYLDYSNIVSTIIQSLKTEKYQLIEEALYDIKKSLFDTYLPIENLHLALFKPSIIEHCRVGISETWARV